MAQEPFQKSSITNQDVGGGNVDRFVQASLPAAQRVAQRLNVPVEAVIGQWGLEVGWGKSVIPGTNNLGNIMDFSGKGVEAVDNKLKRKDKYRQYENVDAFADDFTKLLSSPRYKSVPGTKDPVEYFQKLADSGYAEAKDYAQVGARATNMVAKSLQRSGTQPASAPTVSRETPAPREALPPSLPPMAAAPAPDKLASLGPSYQAALALSFLADTDEKEDRDIDREPGIAEKWLAESATASRPSALAEFSDISIKSPFAALEPRQPVQMFNEGGEVDRLTPQQIERLAEKEAMEREAASKPAFLTPKSGKGRKISTQPGELEAAALQGVSEYPYLLAGSPVDLATMVMRPFGYDVEKPMFGSEDLKERALKAGIRQKPPEGAAARALYEMTQLGASAVNPAAPVRGAVKAAEKVGDAARMLEDMTVGNVQRARIRKAAKDVPEDTAYDPLRDRLEETGNLAYTFVRARPEAAARHAELEAQGLSPEQIRARNLTHKDYRGTVIEEISDAPAVVKKKTTSSPQGFYNVMEHPELQSMYPGYDMPEVMLRTTKRKDAMRASGSYDSQANLIQSTVRDLPPYDALKMTRENLLHEGQHAIQDIEGFVGGANPSSFIAYVKARKGTYSSDPTVNANVIREMERAFPNLPQVTDNFTTGFANADKYKRYAAGDPDTYIGESLYRHVPGEVQAELARIRGDLTPEQLRQTPHEASMQLLGIDPNNILQINKMGSRPDRYIGDVGYSPSSAAAQLGMIKDSNKISGPIFSPIPSADAPFVGRLDEFVSGLPGPVQKDQFLGMLKGKMRDYDIARAETTLADLPGNAKLTPVDLLNRIKTQYDPSQFKTTVVPPGSKISNYQSTDNPYQGVTGDGPPLGVIHLSQLADPKAAQIDEIADMANNALIRLGSSSAFHSHSVMQLKTANDLLRAADSPILGLSESTASGMRTLGTQYRQIASQKKAIDSVLNDIFYPASDPNYSKKVNAYANELENQGVRYDKSYHDAAVRFTKERFEENNKILRDNNLPTVPVPDFDSLKNPVLWAIEDTPRSEELKAQVLDLLKDAKKPLNEALETMKGTADELMGKFQTEIKRAPPYKGQHSALKNSPDNPISFSRFSEHTTDIPGIGKAEGIYVNELQSDLLDDLRKKGLKGGSLEKDEKKLRELEGSMRGITDPTERKAIESKMRNLRTRLFEGMGPNNTPKAGFYELSESFPGMASSPQVAQQLMVKNAINGAIQMGKQFVAFPGAESAQAQLYEKLGPNLKSVVKDLGPGFELRDVTLRDPDGKQLMHKAIVWGPDAAARVQKKGVPFKDGGAVERQTADHRKYL